MHGWKGCDIVCTLNFINYTQTLCASGDNEEVTWTCWDQRAFRWTEIFKDQATANSLGHMKVSSLFLVSVQVNFGVTWPTNQTMQPGKKKPSGLVGLWDQKQENGVAVERVKKCYLRIKESPINGVSSIRSRKTEAQGLLLQFLSLRRSSVVGCFWLGRT